MKTFFSTACLAPVLFLLASCGSTRHSASAPTGVEEFDQATGSWKPATKIVAPPPHQESAPLPMVASQTEAIPQHHSIWHKVGATARKPLHWVGLGKDEEDVPAGPPPVQIKGTTPDGKPIKAAEEPPAPPSPIAPRPGVRNLWQRIGDTVKAPFHWMGI